LRQAHIEPLVEVKAKLKQAESEMSSAPRHASRASGWLHPAFTPKPPCSSQPSCSSASSVARASPRRGEHSPAPSGARHRPAPALCGVGRVPLRVPREVITPVCRSTRAAERRLENTCLGILLYVSSPGALPHSWHPT